MPIREEDERVAALLGEWPWDVFTDRDGNNWFLSANSPPVLRRKDGRVERIAGPAPLAPFEVSDIAQTPDGRLWLAVKHRGLALVESVNESPIVVQDISARLPSRNVLEVVAMTDGSLWMAQPNTIMHWDPTTDASRVLNVLDGIAPAPLNLDPRHDPAPYPLLVGTWEGFYMVHREVLKDASAPRVQVPAVLVGDSVWWWHADLDRSELQLPVAPDRITFLLRTDNLIDPQRDGLAYRITELDTAWSPMTDEERITFNHLGPGTYRFQVKARTNNGPWGSITTVAFNVPPPFWATWWIRLLMLLLILLCAWALFRLLLRKRLRKERERLERERALMDERMRIAHDLHDDLGSALALIAMEGELARMGDGSGAQDALKRVSEGAREVTDNMRRIVWALGSGQDTLGDLVAYIRSSAAELLERAGVELEARIELLWPELPLTVDQRRHLLLLMKELLLNVVKHARAREVTLRIEQRHEELTIIVADDGQGFDVAERKAVGTGLTSLHERVKALGGGLDVHSSTQEGTCITIRVPVRARVV